MALQRGLSIKGEGQKKGETTEQIIYDFGKNNITNAKDTMSNTRQKPPEHTAVRTVIAAIKAVADFSQQWPHQIANLREFAQNFPFALSDISEKVGEA